MRFIHTFQSEDVHFANKKTPFLRTAFFCWHICYLFSPRKQKRGEVNPQVLSTFSRFRPSGEMRGTVFATQAKTRGS